MAQSMNEWNGSSVVSEQPYFPGKVHKHPAQPGATQRAEELVLRFEAATPSTDPQAIIWSDASCGGRNERTTGGISFVCNICIPGKPKYTISEARYEESTNNINLLEAKGIHLGLQRLKDELQSAKLAPGTCLTVNVVTDNLANVGNMSRVKPLRSTVPTAYITVLRAIKALLDSFVDLKLKFTLELHWCPRKRTPQMIEADFLAGRARKQRKRIREEQYDTGVQAKPRDYQEPITNSETPKTKTEIVERSNLALGRTNHGFIGKANQTRRTRRRKTASGRVIDEGVDDSPKSASRRHKRQRVRIEEPQAVPSNNEPHGTITIPENTQEGQPDNGQIRRGARRRWIQCMVM